MLYSLLLYRYTKCILWLSNKITVFKMFKQALDDNKYPDNIHSDAILLQTLEAIVTSIERCQTYEQLVNVEGTIPVRLLNKFEYNRIAWLLPLITGASQRKRFELAAIGENNKQSG